MIAVRESPAMGLRDFFDRVYTPRKLPTRNPETQRLYTFCLRRLAEWMDRRPIVADLENESLLIDFLEFYGAGRSAVSRNKFRNHLSALAGLAWRRGLIRRPPDLPDIPEPRRTPIALTPDHVAMLVAAAAGLHGEICGVPAPLYWRALVRTALSTGLRAGALFALRRADVDLLAGSLLAVAETQKQLADQRLRLAPAAVAALAAIWQPERELVWPWDRHPTTRYHYLRRLCVAAGLPDDRRHKLHALRKTCATWTHRHGGDATAQLGHASDATTRRSYLDPSAFIQAADCIPWGDLLPPDDPQRRLF